MRMPFRFTAITRPDERRRRLRLARFGFLAKHLAAPPFSADRKSLPTFENLRDALHRDATLMHLAVASRSVLDISLLGRYVPPSGIASCL